MNDSIDTHRHLKGDTFIQRGIKNNTEFRIYEESRKRDSNNFMFSSRR